eukprot:364799-Chlamydomonas_euryale.AAC.2
MLKREGWGRKRERKEKGWKGAEDREGGGRKEGRSAALLARTAIYPTKSFIFHPTCSQFALATPRHTPHTPPPSHTFACSQLAITTATPAPKLHLFPTPLPVAPHAHLRARRGALLPPTLRPRHGSKPRPGWPVSGARVSGAREWSA